ncbi:methyl-accepting chemotaxis protein [Paenibacillus sp. JX-17]|uniref:Methyl-accepting chemotaxis protein n=1 Tax=Paenibacillus lacisoli TaxID=3064525 RepID=A0ABT9CCG1_9BACL|nr:methyl-accepting chemotaxis protein [Paenibacillus sp. JX-17]MDO7906947.1 methyl-accepting chemotaxis protein [Paenibacillus sp. JX-17]
MTITKAKFKPSRRKERIQEGTKRSLSIRSRLIYSFLTILLIPTILISWTSFQTAKEKIDQQMIAAAEENVDRLNNIINEYVSAKFQEVAWLGRLTDLSNVTPLNGSNVGDSAPVRTILDSFMQAHPEVELAYVGTESGLYMNSPSTFANPADYDPRVREWYTSAMKTAGDVIITSPYVSKATGNLVVTVARTTEDGHGVAAINVKVNKISEITQKVKIGSEGYAYIMDANKNFVSHPTKEAGTKAPDNVQNNNLYKSDSGYFDYLYENKDMKKMAFTTNKLTHWKIAGTMYQDEVTQQAAPILRITLIVLIASMIIGGLLVLWILTSILKPLKRLHTVSGRISEGDLTERVQNIGSDELGRLGISFNNMADSLQQIIEKVGDTTDQLASSAEEMAASADQSSKSSEQSAESIQQVAHGAAEQVRSIRSTSQEMDGMIEQLGTVSRHAGEVVLSSAETSARAQQGNETAQTAVLQMNSIGSKVENLAKDIEGFRERSLQVVQIVEVITGIASQTNLLALNASIEAARAGEYGAGFAVVASEIRKLAEQSNQSALQITELVRAIEQEAAAAAVSMDAVYHEVREGIGMVDETGKVFGEIYSSIEEVVQQIQSVSVSSDTMSRNAGKVLADMADVTQISEEASVSIQDVVAGTEEQLAAIQEIAASAQHLSGMAEELQTAVEKFKIKN